MKILKYGVAFITLLVSACERTDNEEIYNENNTNVIGGVVYDTEENPINGIYKTYYSTGAVKMEISARNGLPEGEGKFYDENGNIQFSGTFANGKINGKFYQYYEDGTIHNELNYINGVRNENQILYDNNGQVSAEIVYENGKAVSGYVIIDNKKIALEDEDLKDLSQNTAIEIEQPILKQNEDEYEGENENEDEGGNEEQTQNQPERQTGE